ncbi:jg27695 [Pararge aegeria aegeria]|uniref:Jg27695 protein n=1 Tax=Pararge aegeria aegeria TaxID=348720 RepID=A0A8S4QXQ0_9NEOP|nr:jg27695 [Pararge aegeria aegeria]
MWLWQIRILYFDHHPRIWYLAKKGNITSIFHHDDPSAQRGDYGQTRLAVDDDGDYDDIFKQSRHDAWKVSPSRTSSHTNSSATTKMMDYLI